MGLGFRAEGLGFRGLEKNMETTTGNWCYIGNNGKENGNYYSILGLYWCYIGECSPFAKVIVLPEALCARQISWRTELRWMQESNPKP